jgi:hypothetical protein
MAKQSGGSSKENPATNTGEKDASIDHAIEQAETGKDPIPTEAPDWAKDLPSPKGPEKEKD